MGGKIKPDNSKDRYYGKQVMLLRDLNEKADFMIRLAENIKYDIERLLNDQQST